MSCGGAVIAVDIPIGPPEPHGGPRRADLEARRALGGRASSVFTTYPREVYAAGSYDEAKRIARELAGAKKGLSKQAFAIGGRILEVDEAVNRGVRAYEVHPEVSFRELAGGRLLSGKKTWNGHRQRLKALADVGIELPDDLGGAGEVPGDDVLDAAAAAWSASRIAAGTACCLPVDPAPTEPVIRY